MRTGHHIRYILLPGISKFESGEPDLRVSSPIACDMQTGPHYILFFELFGGFCWEIKWFLHSCQITPKMFGCVAVYHPAPPACISSFYYNWLRSPVCNFQAARALSSLLLLLILYIGQDFLSNHSRDISLSRGISTTLLLTTWREILVTDVRRRPDEVRRVMISRICLPPGLTQIIV